METLFFDLIGKWKLSVYARISNTLRTLKALEKIWRWETYIGRSGSLSLKLAGSSNGKSLGIAICHRFNQYLICMASFVQVSSPQLNALLTSRVLLLLLALSMRLMHLILHGGLSWPSVKRSPSPLSSRI